MRCIKQKGVSIKPMGDKQWVEVYFNNESFYWVPTLKELAEIAAKIGVCEDEKYGWPENNAKGAEMVSNFLKEAIDGGVIRDGELSDLCDKYGIPARRIVAGSELADKA